MNWLSKAFSAPPDLSRVNPVGLIMMAAAVCMVLFAGCAARMLKTNNPERTKNAIKIAALILCAGGALLAILG